MIFRPSLSPKFVIRMVLMKYFCFYFPVRLGVIITSVISIGQASVFLIYGVLNDANHFKDIISGVQENIEVYSTNQIFDKFLELSASCKPLKMFLDESIKFWISDTEEFRLASLGFCACFLFACLLNIVAALKIWRWLSVPYILMDSIRLSALLACHVILMMIFKKQLNLGVLIAACSFGGFFLLFLAYMWSCSIALFQMIGVVNSKAYQKIVSLGSPVPEKIYRNITISSISSSIKPLMSDRKNEKTVMDGIFASDFSEYYLRQPGSRYWISTCTCT